MQSCCQDLKPQDQGQDFKPLDQDQGQDFESQDQDFELQDQDFENYINLCLHFHDKKIVKSDF